MYQGSCLCGAIKVEINGPITDIIHCHCSLCRKSSGTAYATNGFIQAESLKVIDPEQQLRYFERKEGRRRHFCSNCASPVYSSSSADPARYRIRLGILDTPIRERPISHNFVTSKADWEDLDAALPRYEQYEPSRNK
ncbi:GFA family protein [Endozoicomonadaceae bacterium StTr2]